MLLLATAMLMFGLPLNMLNLSREDDSELIAEERFAWWIADAIYNQYLLMLGEFGIRENFMKGSDKVLVILLFVGATFFAQITMLNMLIAIMGDVFDELTEHREVKATEMKLAILAEQAPVLN